jgi:hypothetical protein
MSRRKQETRYPQPVGMFLKNPPHFAYYNRDWRKPPVDVQNCVLELGRFYWIRRPWINEELTKVAFLKITGKGYGFIREDGTRLFKRPMYHNKYRTVKDDVKITFCIHQGITIYQSEEDGISKAETA